MDSGLVGFEFDYMREDSVMTRVEVTDLKDIVIENYTDNIAWRFFGVYEKPTIPMLYHFIEERCVPRTRVNINDLLKCMGLSEYNPYDIVRITHGVMVDDCYWLRFPEERGKLTYRELLKSLGIRRNGYV